MKIKNLLIIVLLIGLAAGFGAGIWYSSANSIPQIKILTNRESQAVDVDFGLFWRVWDMLSAKYVDKGLLDPQKMVYGAISGMVGSLDDPYTVFLEPDNSKKFEEEISGAFGGIGIEIDKRNGFLTVIAPIKDTPAERSGIRAGDRILKIDTQPTLDLTVEEAVSLIRGRPGTKVVLTLTQKDARETRDVTLTREIIRIPSTALKYIESNGKKIAYLRLYVFNQNIDSEFKKNANDILRNKPESLILDVRNNPGGLLESSVNIAGYFVDNGALVTTERFGDGKSNEFQASGNAELKHIPTVMLINGGSASASEILAGALHDNRGIKLIGEMTFGKGSVQELEKFNDGSSLKVTVANWLTPSGINISKKGIEPDIKIEIPEDASPEQFTLGEQGKDPQLDKALEIFK